MTSEPKENTKYQKPQPARKGDSSASNRELTKLEQLRLRRLSRGGSDAADWGSVNGEFLASAVAAITRHGFGVTLSYTKDRGAYSITVLGDGETVSEYIRPTEDVDLYLRSLAADFTDLR